MHDNTMACQLMCRQIAGCCKSLVTDFAQKRWLASGVNALMSRQIAGLREPFVTDFAYKRWQASGVSALMFRQIAGCCKPFITNLAHIRFLSSPCGAPRSGVVRCGPYVAAVISLNL